MRGGCSLLLNHIVVMIMRDGAIADSKIPRRTRVVTRPAQLLQAEVHARIRPQTVTITPIYFPVGKRCIPQA